MSVQSGVYYFDERPISPGWTNAVGRYLNAFGPDGKGQYVATGVAMLHRALHITPEDVHECQPLISASGRVLTWDGRLDNREDLCLELWCAQPDTIGDGALALAAYEHWGDAAFARLIGDWSLVIWDEKTRELTLASDYAGNRPLFYLERERELHWSSSLAELVDRLNLRDELDERFLIGYIAGVPPPDVTPYRHVASISTAHTVTWSPDKPKRRRRFWDLRFNELHFADSRDYESHLRSLFARAVRSRLRSSRPGWAELSGGLDSSAIVCMADQLTVQGALSAPIETVSYVTDTSPEADERSFIATVEEQRGKRSHYVTAEACMDLMDDSWNWVTPWFPTGTALAIFRTISAKGGRVLLSGNPGDLIMMNYPEDLTTVIDALHARRISRSLTAAREWSRACQRPIWELTAQVVDQCWPFNRIERLLREDVRRYATLSGDIERDAMDAFHFTSRSARLWHETSITRIRHVTRRATAGKTTVVKNLLSFLASRRFYTQPEIVGVTYTHPYIDRPLVEFMLSLPAGVACRPGSPRALMKRAFSDMLPARIARRFSKGYVDPFTMRKLRSWLPQNPAQLDRFHLVQAGLVDRDRLASALHQVRLGSCRTVRNLELLLKLERWLAHRRQEPTYAVGNS